jgi:hypothetical protein
MTETNLKPGIQHQTHGDQQTKPYGMAKPYGMPWGYSGSLFPLLQIHQYRRAIGIGEGEGRGVEP